ncbi:MAG: hypothetical protein HY300_12870 [Verrucomicrobia bacterium]|nr:hypothetical protein [Verrucomicrobiota bacterium]
MLAKLARENFMAQAVDMFAVPVVGDRDGETAGGSSIVPTMRNRLLKEQCFHIHGRRR